MKRSLFILSSTTLFFFLLIVPLQSGEAPEEPPGHELDFKKSYRWTFWSAEPGMHGALFDLDGDGAQEIIFSGVQPGRRDVSLVYVLKGDGQHLKGWPRKSGLRTPKVPLIGDIDGDGEVEVLVSDGLRITQWDRRGHLIGKKGTSLPLVQQAMHSWGEGALGDIDGDGKLELVFGTWSKQIVALDLGADPRLVEGFPIATSGVMGSSPALADLDGDGRDEVVMSTEGDGLYFIDVENQGARWKKAVGSDGLAVSMSSRASATIGDLDGSGELRVVIGSYAGDFYAFSPRGELSWTFQALYNTYASSALVDLNKDGKLEIMVPIYGDFRGGLQAFTADGHLHPGWAKRTYLFNGNSGVVAGDIDGNGEVDLVASDFYGNITVYDARGKRMAIIKGGGKQPLLGDVDGDGLLDLVLIRQGVGVDLYGLSAPANPPPPWPMERLDARRSGTLP